MSITLGDNLKHNNPIFPIVDIEDVKGGTRVIATFSNTDLYSAFNGIPDKLKQNYTNLIVTSTSQHYYLSGTDATITTSWKLTGSGLSASGTTNSIAKWTSSASLGDSLITDNGDTVTINGNLTVIGTSSTITSENLFVKDPIILLAGSQSTPLFDAGLFVNRGTGDTQAFIWDESSSEFSFFSTTSSATTSGNVLIGTYSNVRTGPLSVGTGITSSSRFSVSSNGGTLSLVVNEQGDTIFRGDTKIIGTTFSISNLPPGSITFGSKTAIYSPNSAEIVIGTDTSIGYNYQNGWKFTGYQITNLWGNAIEFQNTMGTIGNLWVGSNYTFAGFNPFVNTQQSTLFVKGTTSSIMRVVGTGATWSNSASIFEINDNGNVGIGMGTASPSTKLHIFATQSGAFRLQDGTEGLYKFLTSDINGVSSWTSSAWIKSGNDIYNSNSGYVNIGSTQSISGSKLFIQSSGTSSTIGSNIMLDLYNGDNNSLATLSEISFSSQGQAFASIPYDVRHRYAIISGYATAWNNVTTGGGIKFSTRATTGASLVTALVVDPNGSVYNASRGSNTIYGLNAISSTYSTGTNNTAIGTSVLQNNLGGLNNTAVGYQSLYNNTSTGPIASLMIIMDGGSGYTASSTFSNVQLSYISGSTAVTYPIVNVYVGATGSVSTVTLVSSGTGFKDTTTLMGTDLGIGVTFSVKLSYIVYGYSNTAVGYQSLYSNTTGFNNIAIGDIVLYSNTTGTYNTAVGYESMYNTTTTLGTGIVGGQSLTGLGTIKGGSGYVNGTYSNVSLTYLSGSTAISYPTGVQIVVSGGSVTSVTLGTNFGTGFKDLSTIMTAPASSIGGSGTGFSVRINNLIVPSYNTTLGYRSLYSNKSAGLNVAIGAYSLYSSVVTDTTNQSWPSTAVGAYTLMYNTTGQNNTAVGFAALQSNTTGNYNTGIGQFSLQYNTLGFYNTAIGQTSLYYNTTGYQNTGLGASALQGNTTGGSNTAVGFGSMQYSVDGYLNTALGFGSLANLNTGGFFGFSSYNTAVGGQALFNTTTGSYNTAVGNNSFLWNKAGSYNTGIGYESLNFANSGNYNTALGNNSLYKNNKGDYNVAIGKGALNWNTSIISALAATFSPGSNYTPGTYSGIPLNYKSGTVYYPGNQLADFPLADIIVGPGGTVSSVTLTDGGSVVHDTSIVLGVWENGYSPYGLPILPGVGGSGFRINIASVTPAGTYNTALGVHSLYNVRTGSYNVALGSYAGSNSNLVNATASIYIGYNANSTSLNVSNEIVIGYGATGSGSNSVTLGADTITKTKLRGIINLGNVPPYNNNGDAITGGLVPGDIYRITSTNVLMVVV